MGGILPPFLKWRIQNGFPAQHITTTELVDGEYIKRTFEQGAPPIKKPKNNNRGIHTHPGTSPRL